MAQPIGSSVPPRDPRAEFVDRLRTAPADHAEAVLAAYDVLQGLQDRGILDLLRGALGSSDALVQIGVGVAGTPQSIRALRNLLLLTSMLGTLEPDLLAHVTRAVPKALAQASADEARPPRLLQLLSTFLDKDFRRGLAAANDLFIAFGRSLRAKKRA